MEGNSGTALDRNCTGQDRNCTGQASHGRKLHWTGKPRSGTALKLHWAGKPRNCTGGQKLHWTGKPRSSKNPHSAEMEGCGCEKCSSWDSPVGVSRGSRRFREQTPIRNMRSTRLPIHKPRGLSRRSTLCAPFLREPSYAAVHARHTCISRDRLARHSLVQHLPGA